MLSDERPRDADLLGLAPACLLLLDRDGRNALANRLAEATFVYDRDGLGGKPLAAVVPGDARQAAAALLVVGPGGRRSNSSPGGRTGGVSAGGGRRPSG